ncbi:MAG: ABC transporter permease [Lachnospiraceae bacterium]|nr:ABC transporter permease [Lachnospiraceae bacterium]
MKWIWHLCWANMKQRGIRTFLTILGVVIGIVSIVSLMAIGLGTKKVLLTMAGEEGSATEIRIRGITEGKRKDQMITDRRLEEVRKLDAVAAVYPILSVDARFSYDNYVGYWTIDGIPQEYLDEIETLHGNQSEGDNWIPELIMGNQVLNLFFNEVTGTSYGEIHESDSSEETEDLTGKKLETTFSQAGSNSETKVRLPITDMTKQNSYSIYCNQDELKLYLKRLADGGKIPGQPVNQNDENYNEWIYGSAIVEADDIKSVKKLEQALKDMGFQTESNIEFVEYIEKTMKIAQLILAGIGMIALVVAVIGIGNTMTTAVYDRVQEVSMLKVLGADPEELLSLFLLESGILGGIGGMIGVLISYGISGLAVNRLAVKLLSLPKGTMLAEIPIWLAFSAVIFAVILGVAAGFFPARWAAKLNPIEGMRGK